MFIQPAIFNSQIISAQSTRKGGVSVFPYDSLNLGKSTNDVQENVLQNRELFFSSLNIPIDKIALSKQVHGTEILEAGNPIIESGFDALVTNKKNLYLVVSIADCTPILIHDEKNNAVAAIHAGWRGTAAKIVSNTLTRMNTLYGTLGQDCRAFIGACIGYSAFEVGVEVAEHFSDTVKKKRGVDKFLIDLKSENKNQLISFGLRPENIEISTHCTVVNNDLYFSHRHEKGITGRMLAVIGIRE